MKGLAGEGAGPPDYAKLCMHLYMILVKGSISTRSEPIMHT